MKIKTWQERCTGKKGLAAGIGAMGEEITELRAEVERLELALSGKTMCYDPDSYKRGMLDAADITREMLDKENDDSLHSMGYRDGCRRIFLSIHTKAEAMK